MQIYYSVLSSATLAINAVTCICILAVIRSVLHMHHSLNCISTIYMFVVLFSVI